MKRTILLSLLIAGVLWATPAISSPTQTVTDNYWGGRISNISYTYQDMVAGNAEFQIDSFVVKQLTSGLYDLEVTVTGSYFENYFGTYSTKNLAPNYGPGDLYISSKGWITTSGDEVDHYKGDTFNSAEKWDFVVKGPWSGQHNPDGFVETGVYSLNWDTLTYTTNNPNSGYIYRADQAWMGGYGNLVEGAQVKLTSNGMIFQFDTDALNLASNIGLHWTMKCGNDVIEGSARVPEPTSLLFLGLGLLGVCGVRRFKR